MRRTDDEAIDVARPFLDNKYKSYVSWGQSEALPPTDTLRRNWDELRMNRFIIGSPETAIDQVRHHRNDLGIDHLVFRLQWPGLPHMEAMETLRWLVGEVIPAV